MDLIFSQEEAMRKVALQYYPTSLSKVLSLSKQLDELTKLFESHLAKSAR